MVSLGGYENLWNLRCIQQNGRNEHLLNVVPLVYVCLFNLVYPNI